MSHARRTRRPQHATRAGFNLGDIDGARELFWQNVIREMLTSLSMQRARLAGQAAAEQRALVQAGKEPPAPGPLPGFDGRMALVTRTGDRIPIADITPLFACSIGGTMTQRALSEDVQCTIFQVRTPSGEVYTFPVGEIRGFHALTEEAMQELQKQAEALSGGADGASAPFGFAAFTSLARELDEADALPEPTESGE